MFYISIDINLVVEYMVQAIIMAYVTNMTMGLNLWVSDMGSTTSGGQLQGVLIAKALYS